MLGMEDLVNIYRNILLIFGITTSFIVLQHDIHFIPAVFLKETGLFDLLYQHLSMYLYFNSAMLVGEFEWHMSW